MRLGEGIRTRGFRRWYREELTRSHGGLVLLIVCGVGCMFLIELVTREQPMPNRIGALVLFVACGAIGALALRRYLYLLMRAEHAAAQAVCGGCQAYGRLEMIGQQPRRGLLDVRCRACGHGWQMDDGEADA